MDEYRLPNNILIDIDYLIDAVLSETEEGKYFFDCLTGIVLFVPNNESLAIWQAEIGKSNRYTLLEVFSEEDYKCYAGEFCKKILPIGLTKKEISKIEKIIKQSGYGEFRQYLNTETDGWIDGWDQFIHDGAGEYVRDWLLNHPMVTISESFVGCGGCAICEAMKTNQGVLSAHELKTAFQTEGVMKSVTSQLVKSNLDALYPLSNESISPDAIFTLRITLLETKIKIWREVQVKVDITFAELHHIIQDAMGWKNSHLHQFSITTLDKASGTEVFICLPGPDDDIFPRVQFDERKTKLSDWLGSRKIGTLSYEYDFGDCWEHKIELLSISLSDKESYPRCLDGKGACPPEDCGGAYGYENFLKVLKNPKHPEHLDRLEWFGIKEASDINPDYFDPGKVEFSFSKMR